MTKTVHIAAAAILAAALAVAQTTDYGSLRDSHRVVTNEQDLVALQALSNEATVRSNATVALTTNLEAEASARAALGTALLNSVSVAMTNWNAALAIVAQASSNYAAAVAAAASNGAVVVAGAALAMETNRAQVAESAVLQSANATLISSSGLWRLEWQALVNGSNAVQSAALTNAVARLTLGDALRTIQVNTQAWISVTSGTASLWVVSNGPNTNQLLVVASSQNPTNMYYPHFANPGDTFHRTSSTAFVGDNGIDTLSSWDTRVSGGWVMDDYVGNTSGVNSSGPTGTYTCVSGSHWVVTLIYGTLTNSVTNTYPLARIADLPSLAQYCTAAQLAAVSNALAQSVGVAMTNWGSALSTGLTAGSNYAASVANTASNGAVATAGAALAIIATNAVDPVARASVAAKPSYQDVTNTVTGFTWPSFPVADIGRTNAAVTMVLSNDVLYLYGN